MALIFFLYSLTLNLSNSISYSTLVSLLHAFSPSPSTQVVPYTEPFYALFSFAAIYLQTQHAKESYMRKISSAILMALATSFRPIGIIQALQWLPDWCHQLEKLVLKSPSKRTITLPAFLAHSFQTLILGLITCSPFLYHQWTGYQHFCLKPLQSGDLLSVRPWCSDRIPSIYGFVQSHYW